MNNTAVSRRSILKGLGGLGLASVVPASLSSQASAATIPTTIKKITKGSLTYERITCDPMALSKIQSSTFDFGKFQGKPQTLEDRAKTGGYTALVNCDSWANSDHTVGYDPKKIATPVSLQVFGGHMYQNFNRTLSVDYLQDSNRLVLCMKKDGKFGHANNTGLTDAQMQKFLSDSGVLWSAGYGPNLVVWGKKVTDFSQFPHFIYKDAGNPSKGLRPSARTLLGQRSDKTVVIVVVYGKTDRFGATMPDCVNIMFDEKCENAVVLDGGGSSQIWWNGRYVHMSSDTLPPTNWGPRPLGGGFLALRGPLPAYKG